MRIPFTTEQFLDVFRRYNEAVWPLQWVVLLAAVVAVAAALRPATRDGRLPGLLLAALWAWTGATYLAFFRPLGPATPVVATLFLVQAALVAGTAAGRGGLPFRASRDAAGVAGGALIAYALVLYPLLGMALGHRYPAMPTFGAPCPTTILTFGLLCWARPPLPGRLLVIPLLWSVVGVSAATSLGIREDFGLPVAAAIVLTLAVARRRTRRVLRTA